MPTESKTITVQIDPKTWKRLKTVSVNERKSLKAVIAELSREGPLNARQSVTAN